MPSLANSLVARLALADTQPAFRIGLDGKQEWGPGGSAAPDVNLYRSAVGVLKTDGAFQAVGQIVASLGSVANQIALAGDGHVYFGSAVDTNLYRSAASVLKTDSSFIAVGTIQSNGRIFCNDGIWVDGGVGRFIGCFDTTHAIGFFINGAYRYAFNDTDNFQILQAGGKITIGGDTSLYRSAANQLRSDGGFTLAGPLWNYDDAGTAAKGIYFGSSKDTSIYRASAGVLQAGAAMRVDLDLMANRGTANQVWVGHDGGAYAPRIIFGNGLDTVLYRSGAGALKTEGSFSAGSITDPSFPQRIRGYSDVITADANTATSSGWYICNGGSNLPTGSSGQFVLQMLNWNTPPGQYGVQLAFGLNDNSAWRRILYNNSWAAWVQIGITAFPASGITIGGDTNLYRAAASWLQADNLLTIKVPAAGSLALGTRITTDGGIRWAAFGDGHFAWGDGTGTPSDTNLYRNGASSLKTDGSFAVGAWTSLDPGDGGFGLLFGSANQLQVTRAPGTGKLQIYDTGGASGIVFGNANDTNLYRTGAGALRTDGLLYADTLAGGATGGGAQLWARSKTNKLSVSWDGSRLYFWIDNIAVASVPNGFNP